MSEYVCELRKFAQSILASVQGLEESGTTGDDENYSGALAALKSADDAIGGLVDWARRGRVDHP